MTKVTALDAWKRMLTEIDEENWLFVGTINPEMVKWAIKALEEMEDEHGLVTAPTIIEAEE